MNKFKRIVLMVLDSAGIGEMPDSASWGDAGADTIGHILESRKVNLPNLQQLGLAISSLCRICLQLKIRLAVTGNVHLNRTAKIQPPDIGKWRELF
jgi:phosphopentomutase